jgi:hypothetical protein
MGVSCLLRRLFERRLLDRAYRAYADAVIMER